jgi:hypothetical protein
MSKEDGTHPTLRASPSKTLAAWPKPGRRPTSIRSGRRKPGLPGDTPSTGRDDMSESVDWQQGFREALTKLLVKEGSIVREGDNL